MTGPDGPVLVPLPEPVGRRARLGPFPSGHDALKFAAVAGVGALIADATAALVWLPFLAVGAVVAVVRVDGQPVDDRAVDYLRWRYGRSRPPVGVPGPAAARRPGPGRGAPRRAIRILESTGIPIAFLPRREAEALFASYRRLLRTLPDSVHVVVDAAPVDASPYLTPPGTEPPAAARAAHASYDALVRAVLDRRRRRRIRWVVRSPAADGPDDVVAALSEGLTSLGLGAERLEGDRFRRALREIGIPGGGA